jgi:hypothetical protein
VRFDHTGKCHLSSMDFCGCGIAIQIQWTASVDQHGCHCQQSDQFGYTVFHFFLASENGLVTSK